MFEVRRWLISEEYYLTNVFNTREEAEMFYEDHKYDDEACHWEIIKIKE
jgi:hypothetical protein